jgi:hypothetical protein
MKTIVSLAVVGLAVGWSSAVFGEAAHDHMLAEMEKCAVCKYMAEKPELMKDMVWETHKIENGMLCLSTVPKEFKHEFDAVMEKMMHAVEHVKADAQQGKETELCRYCASMGELMKLGAKQEQINTSTGAIDLCTSGDPAVVAKIHEFADKAIAEQQKMKEERTASLQ